MDWFKALGCTWCLARSDAVSCTSISTLAPTLVSANMIEKTQNYDRHCVTLLRCLSSLWYEELSKSNSLHDLLEGEERNTVRCTESYKERLSVLSSSKVFSYTYAQKHKSASSFSNLNFLQVYSQVLYHHVHYHLPSLPVPPPHNKRPLPSHYRHPLLQRQHRRLPNQLRNLRHTTVLLRSLLL